MPAPIGSKPIKTVKAKTTPKNDTNPVVIKVKIEVKKFDDNQTYELAQRITWETFGTVHTVSQVTGADLNYAVRTVYAEAGGTDVGTQQERKAMADMLTNRIGASGVKDGNVARTYTAVVQAPDQFESYHEKDTGKPSPKFLRGDKPNDLRGNELLSWNLAYDAVLTEIKGSGSGPTYPYTSNRSGAQQGWISIGASCFKTDSCGWEWERRSDGSMGWQWKGIGRKTTAIPTTKPKDR
jgi:hypothetical protein